MAEQNQQHKKTTLETLSKEDLLKRCKNLLVIAQKAKTAKDETSEELSRVQKEVETLREQVKNGREGDISAEKEEVLALKKMNADMKSQLEVVQEMAASLTEKKLQLAMEMDSLKKKYDIINNELHKKKAREETLLAEKEIAEKGAEELSSVAESYKRQLKRLTVENEELIVNLDKMEQELSLLKNEKKSLASQLNDNENDSENLKTKVQTVHCQCEQEINENRADDEQKIDYSRAEYSDENEREFRDKVCELESVINSLKNEVEKMNKEKTSLTGMLQDTKEQLNSFSKRNDQLNLDISKLQGLSECGSEKDQKINNLKLENGELHGRVSELISEKDVLIGEIEGVRYELSSLQGELKNKVEKLDELQINVSNLSHEKHKIAELENSVQTLSAQLSAANTEKINIAGKVQELSKEIESMNHTLRLKDLEKVELQDELTKTKDYVSELQEGKRQLQCDVEIYLNAAGNFEAQTLQITQFMENCETKCNDTEGKVAMLLNQVENMKVKYSNVDEEKASLLEQVNYFQEQYNSTNGEKTVLLEEVEILREKCNNIDKEKASLLEEIECLKQKGDNTYEEKALLLEKFENLKEKCNTSDKEKTVLLEEMEIMKGKCDKMHKERTGLLNQVEDLEKNHNNISKEKTVLLNQIEKLKEKCKRIDGEKVLLLEQVEYLKVCNHNEGEKTALLKEIENLKEKYNNLQEENNALLEKVEILGEKLNYTVDEKDALLEEIKNLKDICNSLQREKDVLLEQAEISEKKYNNAVGEKDALLEEVKNLKGNYSSIDEEKSVMLEQLQKLEQKYSIAVEERRVFSEKVNNADSNNTELREHLENAQKKVTLLEEEKVALEEMISKIEKEKVSLESDKQTLMCELTTAVTKAEKLEGTVRELNDTIFVANQKREEDDTVIKQEKEEFQEQIELLEKQVVDYQGQIKHFFEKIKVLVKEGVSVENQQVQNINCNENFQKRSAEDWQEKIVCLVTDLKSELDQVQKDICAKEAEVAKLKNEMKKVEKEKSECVIEQERLQHEISLLQKEQLCLSERCEIYEKDKLTVLAELQVMKSESKDIQSNRDGMEELVHQLRQEKMKLEGELEEKEQSLNSMREDCEKSKADKESSNQEMCQLRNKISIANSNLDFVRSAKNEIQHSVSLLREEFIKMCCEGNEEVVKLYTMVVNDYHKRKNEIDDVKKKLDEVNLKNAELLVELNKMNEVIRQRGETISKLEGVKSELSKTISNLESNIDMLQNELDIKTSNISVKDNQILQLEETVRNNRAKQEQLQQESTEGQLEKIQKLEVEISDLKEKLTSVEMEKTRQQQKGNLVEEESTGEKCEGQSEALSTSTFSKTEDTTRMKDLEESFEDRYTKLRMVAVKLKKKVAEQTVVIGSLEAEKKKLMAERGDTHTYFKNFQTMQQEYDRVQDELEVQKLKIKTYTKDLEAAVTEVMTVKQKLLQMTEEKEKLQKDLENMKKEKKSTDSSVRELRNQVQAVQKEKEAEVIKTGEAVRQTEKMKEELKNMEKKLADEKQKLMESQELLDQAKQESKKQSLLDLEIADYDRTVSDLTAQLDRRRVEVGGLEKEMQWQQECMEGLQAQISQLEEQGQMDRDRADNMKEMLISTRNKLSDTENASIQKDAIVLHLKEKLEEVTGEMERLRIQLAELAVDKQKDGENFRNQQESLHRQVRVLEDKVRGQHEELQIMELELTSTKADYETYKVRAQSVLKQQRAKQTPSAMQINGSEEEKEKLERMVDSLKQKIHDMSAQLTASSTAMTSLQEEHDNLLLRHTQLVQDRAKSEAQWFNQVEQLNCELTQMRENHQQNLSHLQLQNDTLSRTYKLQLQKLQEDHNHQVTTLQKKITDSEEKIVQMQHNLSQTQVQPGTPSVPHVTSAATMLSPIKAHDDLHVDVAMMEREAAEGSENVEPIGLKPIGECRVEPLPLEQLLNSPLHTEDMISVVSNDSTAASSKEIEVLENRISQADQRISHLTALLSDSEANSARMSQLSDVLKEEIRRHERSEERQKHLQNTEYLKNVVLKFLMLQVGDERTRLVPVLKTILKLSPEEVAQLNLYASGEADQEKKGRGLNNYLHLWTSAQ